MSGNNLTFKNLRLVSAPLLKNFLENTRLWRQVGNEAFARHVAPEENNVKHDEINKTLDTSYCCYHSWLPKIQEINNAQAEKIQRLTNSDDVSKINT